MKRTLFLVLVVSLSAAVIGCTNASKIPQVKAEEQNKEVLQQTAPSGKEAAESVVQDFGKKLQMVSLQAPQDILEKSMQENYGGLVSQALMEKWLSNPPEAPGRLTSSPWPDRIEIQNTEKLSESEYEIKGKIIEITSVEQVSGGAAAKRPVTLVVRKVDKSWLIDDVTLGNYEESGSTEYENSKYGFSFSLPGSWKEYKIVEDKWEGFTSGTADESKASETGPLINIRHPEWTSENPRQDIPIMVFTLEQWNSLQQGKFHIGAAPVGPTELGRNSGYVFALPARYNFAFLTGYEEVEQILSSKPLKAIEAK